MEIEAIAVDTPLLGASRFVAAVAGGTHATLTTKRARPLPRPDFHRLELASFLAHKPVELTTRRLLSFIA